jgi:hypothetical protein
MAQDRAAELTRGLNIAFRLCSEALDVLDACGAPPAIAPNLELTLQEMRRALSDSANSKDNSANTGE